MKRADRFVPRIESCLGMGEAPGEKLSAFAHTKLGGNNSELRIEQLLTLNGYDKFMFEGTNSSYIQVSRSPQNSADYIHDANRFYRTSKTEYPQIKIYK